MRYLILAGVLITIAIGVLGVVHGEADDSPGLQLLGVLFVLGAITFGVRTLRKP